jgi:hypothetical protein
VIAQLGRGQFKVLQGVRVVDRKVPEKADGFHGRALGDLEASLCRSSFFRKMG